MNITLEDAAATARFSETHKRALIRDAGESLFVLMDAEFRNERKQSVRDWVTSKINQAHTLGFEHRPNAVY